MIAARPPTPIVALTSIVALSAALAILAPAAPTANAATTLLGANPADACAALLKAGFGALQIELERAAKTVSDHRRAKKGRRPPVACRRPIRPSARFSAASS